MLKRDLEIIDLDVQDAFLVKPKHFIDERGEFFKFYTRDLLKTRNVVPSFAEEYFSISKKGTIRGMHYQTDPFSQAKFVSCLKGKVLDVIIDMRQSSRTFGKWISVELSGDNIEMLYVPRGFAHGFLSLTENSEVFYKADNDFAPNSERGVLWNDPALNIAWPKMDNYIVSEKDKTWPSFKNAEKLK